LQSQFRTTLGTPGAPEIFDDSVPVQAVAVVASTPQAVSVTVTETLRTATVIAATRLASAAGNTTIGTVGAGKIWRILAVAVAGASDTPAGVGGAFVTLNGIAVVSIEAATIAANARGQAANSVSFNYNACPILTAGQTAVLTNTSILADCRAQVTYVEIDA